MIGVFSKSNTGFCAISTSSGTGGEAKSSIPKS
jgi:hypothetical protein